MAEALGRAQLFAPGGRDGPSVAFGILERFNVSIVELLMQILGAQRAYEANAKAFNPKSRRRKPQKAGPWAPPTL